MLHFVLGHAKSGKTTFLYNELKQRAKDNLCSFLLVPEQATFQNEKKLSEIIPKNSFNTSVTGFSQLSELVFSLYGGKRKKAGGDIEKLLIMSSSAKELAGELNFYTKYHASVPFLEELIALYDELSNSGTTPTDLASFSFMQEDKILKEKTQELSMIFDSYENLYKENYTTEADRYKECSDIIRKNSSYFKNFNIYVDDFIDFTHPQELILESLISCCDDVYISLLAGNREDDAFASALMSKRKLTEYCKKESIDFEDIVLSEDYINPGLKEIKQASSRLYLRGNEGKDENLYTVLAKNPTEELEECAAIIKRFVREKGMRYKDFAIFTPDFEVYAPLMENVFKRYDVPYFADEMTSKDFSPLASLIITASKIASSAKDYDLTDLAFSPLTGIEPVAAGEFINYCYVWSLSLKQQLSKFTNNPEGIKESFTEIEEERLKLIEETRKKLAEPILKLKEAFSKKNLKDAAEGLYRYIEICGALKNLTALAEYMEEAQREEFISQQNQIWEKVCDILDLFSKLSESVEVTPAQISELTAMAISSIKVATIPRSLDLVDVGSPKRMRVESPRCVFILGTSLGHFPEAGSQSRLLNDHDRRVMREGSLLISDISSAELLERAVCCRCLTSSDEMLFVSLCKNDSKGEEVVPSPVFEMCREISANETIYPTALELIESPMSLKEQLAKKIRDNDTLSATLQHISKDYLDENDLRNIERAREKVIHRIDKKDTSHMLFGSDMYLSPSQVECFYNCKYKYFLKYGLKLKPVTRAKLDNLQTGTLIHHLLEFALKKFPDIENEDRDIVASALLKETDSYIKLRIADPSSLLPSQIQSFHNIASWTCMLLTYLSEELSQSDFKPAFFEMPIKRGSDVPPVVLKNNEGEVSVGGIVDRVDTASIEGNNYVRIVDYKSGHKVFSLGDVLKGLNMQMLIYLFSIWENGKNELGNTIPAGILYQPALGKYVSAPRNDEEAAEKEHRKIYKMNGILLKQREVLAAMEKDLSGKFIPYEEEELKPANKKDPDKKSRKQKKNDECTFTIDELLKLRALVEKKIVSMADDLHEGKIEDVPSQKGGISHCDYCEYSSLCSHRKEDAVNEIEDISKEEFLKEAEKYVED